MPAPRPWILAVIGVAAALLVAATIWVANQNGVETPRTPLPLAAARKLARPEGEVGELERRYEDRRERSLREVRALVARLEQQADDQRTRLNEVEADLERTRALLRRLELEPPGAVELDPDATAPGP